jgi:putative Holliday junction resolvase
MREYMIIMAIDYGDARTGIAVCDKTGLLAVPVCTINEWNEDKLIERIIEVSKEYNPDLYVVGLPKNMDSSLGSRAEKCIEFAEHLSQKTGVECIMRDERLTTVSAHIALNQTDTRGKKRKQSVDQVSAVMILQDYLDYLRINSERAGNNGK